MAKKVKELIVPIYNSLLIIGFDAKAIEKCIKQYGLVYDISNSAAGQAIYLEDEESGYTIHVLWIDKALYKQEYLTHESVHAAWHILDSVGVEVTAMNHEALAYLSGWIAQEVHKFYLTGIPKNV